MAGRTRRAERGCITREEGERCRSRNLRGGQIDKPSWFLKQERTGRNEGRREKRRGEMEGERKIHTGEAVCLCWQLSSPLLDKTARRNVRIQSSKFGQTSKSCIIDKEK